jgi:hypothetical protein
MEPRSERREARRRAAVVLPEPSAPKECVKPMISYLSARYSTVEKRLVEILETKRGVNCHLLGDGRMPRGECIVLSPAV